MAVMDGAGRVHVKLSCMIHEYMHEMGMREIVVGCVCIVALMGGGGGLL